MADHGLFSRAVKMQNVASFSSGKILGKLSCFLHPGCRIVVFNLIQSSLGLSSVYRQSDDGHAVAIVNTLRNADKQHLKTMEST